MVLGSSLGGLAAAAYLARSGLRVTLIEEECKRRPTVREPFFLSGLESGGLVLRLLQELALPLIDRRRIERHAIGLQLILPEAWIDIPRGSTALADELELQGICPADEARAWLEAVDVQGQKVRARLWDSAYGLVGTSAGRLVPCSEADLVAGTELPLTPSPLIQFVHSQMEALSSSMKEVSGPLPALPLHATHAGGFSLPPAQPGGIRELLRGRFRTLHGEILSASSLELIQERGDVGVALADRKILARALLVAVPREPLRRVLEEGEGAPEWLEGGLPPAELPTRLFRVESRSVPVGMARRVIVAAGVAGSGAYWLSRTPETQGVESIVVRGPGAAELSAADPLGSIAPFTGSSILPSDPGPLPLWDLGGSELRFSGSPLSPWLQQKPPVLLVGPEAAPGLGFEGELLGARHIARGLSQRLGPRRRIP